ncbi:MAG: conjugal transfer protein TraD [Novosphingobium sp.]
MDDIALDGKVPQARHDMRTWQVERRKRTRHLIELGGLVVKAGVVDLTNDDRTMIYGAMIWIAEKLKSEGGEHARDTWTKLGKMAFEMGRPADPRRGAGKRGCRDPRQRYMPRWHGNAQFPQGNRRRCPCDG